MNAAELFDKYISIAEKVLVLSRVDEEKAQKELEILKKALSEPQVVGENEQELFDAAVYNALSTINTAPEQKKINNQLLEAVTDAKAEISAIKEFL